MKLVIFNSHFIFIGFGIHYHDFPKDDPVPFFLAQELIPGWLKANGIEEATYCPPKGYFVADALIWKHLLAEEPCMRLPDSARCGT